MRTTSDVKLPCDHESCIYLADSSEDLARHKWMEHRPRRRLGEITFPLKLPGGYVDDKGKLHTEVELAKFTGVEEDILGDKHLAASGEHVRRILANCITRVGSIDLPYRGRSSEQRSTASRIVENMLWSDKTFLTVVLRRISVRNGDIYRFNTECSKCKYGPDDRRPPERLDLRTLDIFPLADPAKRVFELTLPDSQQKVRYRHLMTSDEPQIIDLSKRYARDYMTAQLALQIMDVDGKEASISDIKSWTAVDRDHLRLAVDSIDGGIDLNISTECPRCHEVDRGPMRIDAAFFIPSLAGL